MSLQDAARNGIFSSAAIGDRQVSELVGIARGLLADNELNDIEIEFLHKWLVANGAAQENPVLGLLLERIRDLYSDGYVDEIERGELTDTLKQFAANDFELGELLTPISLPLTTPPPNIEFVGQNFCFTGTFSFGKRALCEAAVQRYGGACKSTVSWATNYLVIGDYATAAWANSSFGRKIEAAVAYQQQGSPICIVSEQHWRTYI